MYYCSMELKIYSPHKNIYNCFQQQKEEIDKINKGEEAVLKRNKKK